MIIEKLFLFFDLNIHQKRIIRFLQNKSIKTVIDVGAHKGEFTQNALQIKSVNKRNAFGFSRCSLKSLRFSNLFVSMSDSL